MKKHTATEIVSPYVFVGLSKRYKDTVRFSGERTSTANILKSISLVTGVPFDSMVGKSRVRQVVTARHIAMYLIYRYNNLGLKKVGHMFMRDHSSVIHANKSVQDQMETDKSYLETVEQIKENLLC